MTDINTVTLARLQRWAQHLSQAGYGIIAPQDSPHGPIYAAWQDAPLALAGGLPRLSPKESWFPRSETVAVLQRRGRGWQLDNPTFTELPTVIFGARPCDAVALKRQMPVFLASPADEFFARRSRQVITVVIGCQQPHDEACFCTSVNVDPAGTDSGDVLLTPIAEGRWAVTATTKRGEELLAHGPISEPEPLELEQLWQDSRDAVPVRFDARRVLQALSAGPSLSTQKAVSLPSPPPIAPSLLAESPDQASLVPSFWEDASQGCQSCGTCAFVCPTCHCFDLQEERRGSRGVRLKNWDACTLPLFTRQASGFNPRPNRASRWQQRVEHKFRFYPERHGAILCTGCGRCLRLCPGGVDLLDTLVQLTNYAPREATADSADSANQATHETPAEAAESANLVMRETPADAAESANLATHRITANVAEPVSMTMDRTRADNIYASQIAIIADIVEESPTVRTLRLRLREGEPALSAYQAGQFAMVSALGEGEAPFCIASAPTRPTTLDITFRRVGRVTEALSRLVVGDEVGLRAPLGHGFPVENWRGKNLVLIGGGLGVTPLRALWQYCQDRRGDFGHLDIMLGAKSLAEHCFRREWAQVQATPDLSWHWCIDPPAQSLEEINAEPLAPTCQQCFLPDLVRQVAPTAKNSVAVVCGPPAMIRPTIAALRELGFGDEDIYLTLENRMKCGVGKCGRCNIGSVHVCQDGPVFRVADWSKENRR